MPNIAVIGAGAWGKALALHAARAGASVSLIGRPTAWPDSADLLVLAVPAQQLRAALSRPLPAAPLLLCCKGIEAGTLMLPLEVAASLHPGLPAAVLTGPNFAGEVAAGLPAAAVVAGGPALRQAVIALLATPAFRLYGNGDVVGAQLGGAAKNVIAIAAGVVVGAGYGENARAALVTRGLAELSRLIVAQGGRAETASGLSGLGDLLLTCTGQASRNFSHGVALGQGTAPPSHGVVEGVATAPALCARAAGLDLPICQAVADLLANKLSVADSLKRLLSRPLKDEAE